MFISKSMTRDVVTIDKKANILDATDKMINRKIRHLPVVEHDNRLIGIVSDRDIRSAMPSIISHDYNSKEKREKLSKLKVADIMTPDPITISPSYTLQDALLLLQQTEVGVLPIVDENGILKGIVGVRDLIRAFINVLGIGKPGMLLSIVVEEQTGKMKEIVDAITEEKISFGSTLVAKYWDEGKRAVFPYLLTKDISRVKQKLEKMGFILIDPLEWYLEQLPKTS
ncbi:MAG: CBS domain-containing protein [Desulfobacterales bacterium]|nr:CBS domain-containing protein [Desulfobacterales bacterium]